MATLTEKEFVFLIKANVGFSMLQREQKLWKRIKEKQENVAMQNLCRTKTIWLKDLTFVKFFTGDFI